MRIQDLAIVFLIIILPISIILAAYTQYQIQTINAQTLYDNKLSSATYDAIRAFQINTGENKLSDLNNSRVRDLEASVSTFRNSVMSTFALDGYSQDDLNSYIPALVYTLYDGFYIYSPYKNMNYRYETQKNPNGTDKTDSKENVLYDKEKPKDGNGDNIYGLKPYISYSCRYRKGDNIDVIITYALDNHITVQGMIENEYDISDTGEVTYNGVEIKTEQLKEHIPLYDNSTTYSYIKLQGMKFYLDKKQQGKEKVIARLNENTLTVQCENAKDSDTYEKYREFIEEKNTLAKDYYKDAYNFTEWFKNESGLVNLTYDDAYDTVVDEDGTVNSGKKVWEGNTTPIFQFSDSTGPNIENELSSFNQHRLAVIRHKIEVNLAIAIANYNNYSGANNVFQMPDLKENEWDYIIHNISLISFLQGLPIGGKLYNGYSIVTNSESEEVVLEQNIYILCEDENHKKEYCRIGDRNISNNGTLTIAVGNYAQDVGSAGRLNLDFRRDVITNNDSGRTFYYYPIQDYNPSYNSIVMQNNVNTYDDIYAYVKSQTDELKRAFYTALGRERASKYKTLEDYGL